MNPAVLSFVQEQQWSTFLSLSPVTDTSGCKSPGLMVRWHGQRQKRCIFFFFLKSGLYQYDRIHNGGFIYGVNVSETSSFVRPHTWVERMEISCRVNVTFVSALPFPAPPRPPPHPALVFFSGGWSRFVLKRVLGSRDDKEQSQKGESVLIHCLPPTRMPAEWLWEKRSWFHACVYLTWLKNVLIIAQAYESGWDLGKKGRRGSCCGLFAAACHSML